jgi:hypothetical protein
MESLAPLQERLKTLPSSGSIVNSELYLVYHQLPLLWFGYDPSKHEM